MARYRKHRNSNSSDKSNGSSDGRHRNHSNHGDTRGHVTSPTRCQALLGFDLQDLTSWSGFVQLLAKPTDPSNLALARILFGLLMATDIPQERGLSYADYQWGDPDECRFPLFNSLIVLPLQWMYMVYLAMFCGALGIMFGFLYRLSCLVFVGTYWYIFLLDKTSWNNHSYLYGLCGILFLFTDANRFWSIDGLLFNRTKNTHIPLWNYSLFRLQFFMVYFIAGLKKLDQDWVGGYSMNELSRHWVFSPFTGFLTHEQIDLYIVHFGGLFIDLFIGFFLFFDFTRPLGFLIGLSFHSMNSQLFTIGMFPYTMIATMPLFSRTDWPKTIILHLPLCLQSLLPAVKEPDASSHCLYPKHLIKPEPLHEERRHRRSAEKFYSSAVARDKPGFYQYFFSLFTIVWIITQSFLPYSHFLTKGYNNWTNGLYGYSWDMMVHSWSTQHVRVTYVDRDTGHVGFINPDAFTRNKKRWSSHSDMVKQYSTCIETRLKEHNITNVELYFDVWRSLNDRFQQRMFDPRVDLIRASWNPFRKTPWLMPLLTDLSDWRGELDRIESSIYNTTEDMDVVFIADFPGLTLENYVQEDLKETEISLLQGEIIVELVDQIKNFSLKDGDTMMLPAGEYHNIHTVSEAPSCYMYKFINTTERELAKNITEFETKLEAYHKSLNDTKPDKEADQKEELVNPVEENPDLAAVYEQVKAEQERLFVKSNRTMLQRFRGFMKNKFHEFHRSASMTRVAVKSIISGKTFAQVFNETIGLDEDMADF